MCAPVARRAALWMAAIGTLMLVGSGCNIMTMIGWATGQDRIKPLYDGLEGKRVAVVCRPLATLQFRNASAAKDLARQVSQSLQQNVKKVTLVEQNKIAEWTDENDWDDYPEIGRAVNADIVLGIDLEEFILNEEQTLLQGKASVRMVVYDMQDGGEQVFEHTPKQIVFPPNSPIASADKPEQEFYRQFVGIVGERLARVFYAHEPNLDFAIDSDALN